MDMGIGMGTGKGASTDMMQVGKFGMPHTADKIIEVSNEKFSCHALSNEKGNNSTVAIRKHWTTEEDSILKDRISICNQYQNRLLNYLVHGLKKNMAWTDQEEKTLIALHKDLGSMWAIISTRLPGRSSYDVMNH